MKNKSRDERFPEGEEEEATAAASVVSNTLCITFTKAEFSKGTKCIASGMDATFWVLWGRSY